MITKHGFDYMIDAGLGHGPNDFEGIQLRVIPKGDTADNLWDTTSPALADGPPQERPANAAYADLEKEIGQCGIVSFAEASTSVPFVGAAAGELPCRKPLQPHQILAHLRSSRITQNLARDVCFSCSSKWTSPAPFDQVRSLRQSGH